MPGVRVHLDPALFERVGARAAALSVPLARPLTPGAHLATLVRRALAQAQAEEGDRASRLLAQFIAVPRSVAAAYFRRTQGAVPLDELQSIAYAEALKAARRFRPEAVGATWENLGAAAAPYLRRWAELGVQGLLRERQAEEEQEIRPDQDQPGRWDRLRGEQESDPGTALDLERALQGFTGPRRRRIVQFIAAGADYDVVAAKVGCSVEEVRQVLTELRTHLRQQGIEHEEDEELTIAEAAARTGRSAKSIAKRVRSGRLRGRKLRGEWMVMASEV